MILLNSPSDGKQRTSGVLHLALGGKVKVIKHDQYIGLDVRISVRNWCLGLGIHDATCRLLGLGQGTDPLHICPSRF